MGGTASVHKGPAVHALIVPSSSVPIVQTSKNKVRCELGLKLGKVLDARDSLL